MARHLLFAVFEGPDAVGEEFRASGAVFVVFLDVGMGFGAFGDMLQVSGSGEPFSASSAGFQRVASDDLIADGDCADIVLVFDHDGVCGADVGAGPASDAGVRDRKDGFDGVLGFQCQGGRTDDFLAGPDAETAADATVGRRAGVYSVLAGQVPDSFGLIASRKNFCL